MAEQKERKVGQTGGCKPPGPGRLVTPPLSASFLGSADTTTRRAGPVATGEKVKPTQECADSLPLTCCAVTLAAAVAASAEALQTRPPLPLLENKHADAVNAEPQPSASLERRPWPCRSGRCVYRHSALQLLHY